jgi:hypothetical protein
MYKEILDLNVSNFKKNGSISRNNSEVLDYTEKFAIYIILLLPLQLQLLWLLPLLLLQLLQYETQ